MSGLAVFAFWLCCLVSVLWQTKTDLAFSYSHSHLIVIAISKLRLGHNKGNMKLNKHTSSHAQKLPATGRGCGYIVYNILQSPNHGRTCNIQHAALYFTYTIHKSRVHCALHFLPLKLKFKIGPVGRMHIRMSACSYSDMAECHKTMMLMLDATKRLLAQTQRQTTRGSGSQTHKPNGHHTPQAALYYSKRIRIAHRTA